MWDKFKEFFKERLTETTTLKGVNILTGLLGAWISPENAAHIGVIVVALLGILDLMPDKKLSEAEKLAKKKAEAEAKRAKNLEELGLTEADIIKK